MNPCRAMPRGLMGLPLSRRRRGRKALTNSNEISPFSFRPVASAWAPALTLTGGGGEAQAQKKRRKEGRRRLTLTRLIFHHTYFPPILPSLWHGTMEGLEKRECGNERRRGRARK